MSSQNTSHTQIDAFTECERKHYYSYGEKLTPVDDSLTIARGNVIHYVLSQYYKALQSTEGSQETDRHAHAVGYAAQFIMPEIDKYNVFDSAKFASDVIKLLDLYWQRYREEDLRMRIIGAELRHDVQLTEDVNITVVIDLLVEIPGYGVIAMDHKVTQNFYDVDRVDTSFQLPRYMAALSELGITVDGIWYNEIRHLDTKENKADPSTRFRRTPVPVTPTKVVTIMREHIMAARRIAQVRQGGREEWEKRVIRNPGACMNCRFKSVCDADLNGRDQGIIRETDYRLKPERPAA